jgi:hypothetical protein
MEGRLTISGIECTACPHTLGSGPNRRRVNLRRANNSFRESADSSNGSGEGFLIAEKRGRTLPLSVHILQLSEKPQRSYGLGSRRRRQGFEYCG